MTPRTTHARSSGTHHPLKELRLKARKTLFEIAEACDTSRSTPLRWEEGDMEPTPQHRKAYAKVLGIELAELGALVYANRKVRRSNTK